MRPGIPREAKIGHGIADHGNLIGLQPGFSAEGFHHLRTGFRAVAVVAVDHIAQVSDADMLHIPPRRALGVVGGDPDLQTRGCETFERRSDVTQRNRSAAALTLPQFVEKQEQALALVRPQTLLPRLEDRAPVALRQLAVRGKALGLEVIAADTGKVFGEPLLPFPGREPDHFVEHHAPGCVQVQQRAVLVKKQALDPRHIHGATPPFLCVCSFNVLAGYTQALLLLRNALAVSNGV